MTKLVNSNISFIVPAFNCSHTICETIKSIFKGNFEIGDEVIIVDDTSTDSTFEVICSLQQQYPSIRIYSHKYNKGTAAAGRNTAIENAKNELLFCIDADNVLAEGSISKLKQFMLENNADSAAFQGVFFFINDKNNVSQKRIYPSGKISLNDALAGHVWPGPSGNYMLTKKSWMKAGTYNETVGGAIDSWAFGISQLLNKSKMMVMPNSHYYHRYGYDSTYMREERKGNLSLIAFQILIPFLNLIAEDDLKYLQSEYGRTTWFQNLDERPIKLKNMELGTSGTITMINSGLSEDKTLSKSSLPFKILLTNTYQVLKSFRTKCLSWYFKK